jgi:hypothetical protein
MSARDVTPADSQPLKAARLRVVVADEDAPLREGIASLLREAEGGTAFDRARAARALTEVGLTPPSRRVMPSLCGGPRRRNVEG